MLIFRLIVLSFIISFSNISLAEIYKDFIPYSTLKSIKENYPNGNFEVVNAAWVSNDQAFIKLTGQGIPGKTYLAFSSTDTYWQTFINKLETEIADNPTGDHASSIESIETAKDILSKPLDERLTLDWLRWVPDGVIPLERLISRFGKPDVFAVDDHDFQQYCAWSARNIRANLADDKKLVFSIEYGFTLEEQRKALGLNNPEPPKVENRKPTIRNKKK